MTRSYILPLPAQTRIVAQKFAVGTPVRIDNGSGRFTEGVVESFTPAANFLGNRGNYTVRVTGGVTLFGKPAPVGSIRSVLHTNVLSA